MDFDRAARLIRANDVPPEWQAREPWPGEIEEIAKRMPATTAAAMQIEDAVKACADIRAKLKLKQE